MSQSCGGRRRNVQGRVHVQNCCFALKSNCFLAFLLTFSSWSLLYTKCNYSGTESSQSLFSCRKAKKLKVYEGDKGT